MASMPVCTVYIRSLMRAMRIILLLILYVYNVIKYFSTMKLIIMTHD